MQLKYKYKYLPFYFLLSTFFLHTQSFLSFKYLDIHKLAVLAPTLSSTTTATHVAQAWNQLQIMAGA